MTAAEDRIALIDLDGTLADYDKALRIALAPLQSPGEPPYGERDVEQPHIEARRKLIQSQPGFWRGLDPIPLGFHIVDELRARGFSLHVLTKGPQSNPLAWSEKVEWCTRYLPDAVVTVTGDKSLVYGRVLVDDYAPYFMKWLAVRPRGLVLCVAHAWNEDFAVGGPRAQPNIIRYDGTNLAAVREAISRAYDRPSGASL
jgi:5'(3')-deoxyribonucleotidase